MNVNDCVFCNKDENRKVIYEGKVWIAVMDGYPVSEGHTLLIPKRHVETYFELNEFEMLSLHLAIKKVKEKLDEMYHPDGYNIGMNCGTAAGQTVMHCHVHVIPRYNGDVENPRGGVRGVIPSKKEY